MEISLNSQVVIAKQLLSCDLQGETAILNIKDGISYGLDEVGTSIWKLVQEQVTVEYILKELLRIYDVEIEECRTDLYELLDEMTEKGLLEIR